MTRLAADEVESDVVAPLALRFGLLGLPDLAAELFPLLGREPLRTD